MNRIDTSEGIVTRGGTAMKAGENDLAKALTHAVPIDRDMAIDHDILIVGAGLSGLAMALEARAGGHHVAIIERHATPGGTWALNTYPGAACDVPSHLYQLGRRPSAEWSRPFAPQDEIESYIGRVANALRDDAGVSLRTGLGMARAEWNADHRCWDVHLSDGTHETAKWLVLATGMLHVPRRPSIPGLDEFGGPVLHTAEWDGGFDPKGRRVAVIGTGASAVQVVPPLAETAERLTLFQRTPPWVVAKSDAPFGLRRTWFRRVPGLARLYRYWLYEFHEMRHLVWRGHERSVEWAERMARDTMEAAIGDPALRAKLTPPYRIGCKRILQSNAYYPALARANVEVETAPIERITMGGIITERREREIDAIVLATGFEVANAFGLDVRGRNGRTLREAWATRPLAHCGTTVRGFPNLATLLGPGTALGHNSVVLMAEAQARYLVRLWREQVRAERDKVERGEAGLGAIEPRAEAQDAWREEIDAALLKTVWGLAPGMGGCSSWYHDKAGRPSVVWPGTVRQFRRRLRRSGLGDYEAVASDEAATSDEARAPVASPVPVVHDRL